MFSNFLLNIVFKETHVLCSWEDWFSGSPNVYTDLISNNISTIGNIHVVDACFFHIIGSITVISSIGSRLLIEMTSFVKCERYHLGGAIYFKDFSGSSVLYMCCGSNCRTLGSYNGQFCYIEASLIQSSINELTSIFECPTIMENSRAPLSIYGNITNRNINVSYCNTYYHSVSLMSAKSMFISSNFVNNSCSSIIIENRVSCEYQSTNIISNNQLFSSNPMFRMYNCNANFSSCIICSNTAPQSTFLAQSMSGYYISFKDSYLQNDYSYQGTVYDIQPRTDDQTHDLLLFITDLCKYMPTPQMTQSPTSNAQNVVISDTFFYQIENGAIIIQLDNIYQIISDTTFVMCTNSNHGGAILFDSAINGFLEIQRVCASHCSTNAFHNGQFLYGSVNSDDNPLVSISELSNVFCSPTINNNEASIYILNANFSQQYVNSSYNQCNSYSSLSISTTSDSSFTNFCTIINNTASNFGCTIHCYSNPQISFSNYISNSQYSPSNGLFMSIQSLVHYSSCTFQNNISPNAHFYIEFGSTVNLHNCYSSTSLTYIGSLTQSNPQIMSTYIYHSVYHTNNCINIINTPLIYQKIVNHYIIFTILVICG